MPQRKAGQPSSPQSPALRTPWSAAATVVRVSREHWTSRLSRYERSRLIHLLKASRGRPRRLSAPARNELQRLTDQLDLKGLARRTVAEPEPDRSRTLRGR